MRDPARAEYGNWVSKKFVYGPFAAGLLFFGLAFFYSLLAILAGVAFMASAYFAYARYEFAPRGGNVQDRIIDLMLGHLTWDGKGRALDIGCGNAALTIKLARRYPEAQVVGTDYWGGSWEYSKGMCQKNAEIEGVGDRVSFQKASASSLPFEDGYFDVAVSNLVFHEVRDAADKRELIREALRVVRKGGRFVFQDLFLIKGTFGNTDELLEAVRSWGTSRVEFIQTRDAPFIPTSLKLPFMVGTMGVLAGEK